MESLAARLAGLPEATEGGEWHRHVAAGYVLHALEGRAAYGRWGTRGGFPVLYLGRPHESVVVEAFRHLVDPVELDSSAERQAFIDNLMPRVLITCSVDVTNLLDLRTAAARAEAGLTMQDLTSSVADREAYARCQYVAQVAHQLRRHGIVTPAATGLGETLAAFHGRSAGGTTPEAEPGRRAVAQVAARPPRQGRPPSPRCSRGRLGRWLDWMRAGDVLTAQKGQRRHVIH